MRPKSALLLTRQPLPERSRWARDRRRLGPCKEEQEMPNATLTRRTLLRTGGLAATALSLPFVRGARAAAGGVVPKGKMVLAWHTNIASRWLDPQQHDGTASPDNFLNALHDGLIKNSGSQKFDHLALAEKYQFAEDAKSCSFTLRAGLKFHDGSPVTPQDVKWSY